MQDDLRRDPPFSLPKSGLPDRLGRMCGGFFRIDLPFHEFLTIKIQNQVQIEKMTFDGRGEVGDIPWFGSGGIKRGWGA